MKNRFKKILKSAQEITNLVSARDFKGVTEDDLDHLSEAIILLNDAYEVMYDEVFVTLEDE